MSNFKNIENKMINEEFPISNKLGLKAIYKLEQGYGHYVFNGEAVFKAKDVEAIFQSAQVVYGHVKQDMPHWWGPRENGQFDDTHTALVIGITPIKKKTKAEAALEFVEKFKSGMLSHVGYLEAEKEAIRILEMKDEV